MDVAFTPRIKITNMTDGTIETLGRDVIGVVVAVIGAGIAIGVGALVFSAINNASGLNIPNPFTSSLSSTAMTLLVTIIVVVAASAMIGVLVSRLKGLWK